MGCERDQPNRDDSRFSQTSWDLARARRLAVDHSAIHILLPWKRVIPRKRTKGVVKEWIVRHLLIEAPRNGFAVCQNYDFPCSRPLDRTTE
jgi:hypothetical protein